MRALLLILLPAAGLAIGPGFGIDFHQVEISGGGNGDPVKAEFPVYRYVLIDNGGLIASFILTLGSGAKGMSIDTQREDHGSYTRETTTYRHSGEGIRNVDVTDVEDGWSPGEVRTSIRFAFEYASSADEGDVQYDRTPVHTSGVDFSEVRVLLGGTTGFAGFFYFDFNVIDLIWRDLRFEEPGAGVDGIRGGAFLEQDLVGLVDSLFDGTPGGSAVGLTARLNFDRFFALEAKLKSYGLHGGSNFDPAEVRGRSFGVFASVEI